MDDASVFSQADRDDALPRQRELTVTCPTRNAAAPWQGNALIDLGVWLDEADRVPADEDGNVP